MRYKLANGSSASSLEEHVNRLLSDGWILAGSGFSIGQYKTPVQPMTFEESQAKKTPTKKVGAKK